MLLSALGFHPNATLGIRTCTRFLSYTPKSTNADTPRQENHSRSPFHISETSGRNNRRFLKPFNRRACDRCISGDRLVTRKLSKRFLRFFVERNFSRRRRRRRGEGPRRRRCASEESQTVATFADGHLRGRRSSWLAHVLTSLGFSKGLRRNPGERCISSRPRSLMTPPRPHRVPSALVISFPHRFLLPVRSWAIYQPREKKPLLISPRSPPVLRRLLRRPADSPPRPRTFLLSITAPLVSCLLLASPSTLAR